MSDRAVKRLISAEWIFPAVGPLQRHAGVVIFDDHVLAIGPTKELHQAHPDADELHLRDAIILPGLVNAHVHLELSNLNPGDTPSSFVDWIQRLLESDPGDLAAAVRNGIGQSLRAGVTTVGDITTDPARVRPLLHGIRAVSYGEVRAMAKRRELLRGRLDAAIAPSPNPMVRPGISPHAPYSIELEGYRACLAEASARGLPFATHLAETRDEHEFISHQTGAFRNLWSALDAWDDHVPRFDGSPIEFAKVVGLLDYPALLAHVNYCSDDDLDLLAVGRASVVYCPRTHAYFGHPPHRFREMFARGVNVAVGTDSTASSPNLDLVDDLAWIHRIAPEMPAGEVWRMATTCAARALQWDDKVGAIAPGYFADVTVFPVRTETPLLEILEQPRSPQAIWLAGKPINLA